MASRVTSDGRPHGARPRDLGGGPRWAQPQELRTDEARVDQPRPGARARRTFTAVPAAGERRSARTDKRNGLLGWGGRVWVPHTAGIGRGTRKTEPCKSGLGV